MLQESDSLAVFSELLRYTSVRELSLCNARLHLAVHEGPLARLGRRDDAGAELLRAAPPPACPAIVFLRLAGFQVSNPLFQATIPQGNEKDPARTSDFTASFATTN